MTANKEFLNELLNKATTYYQKAQMSNAIKVIKDILHEAKGELRVKALDLLAKICVDRDYLEKAIEIYLKALRHVPADHWSEKANLYNKLGILYQAIKNIDEALKYQLLCLEALEKEGNKEFMALTYKNLGRLYTLKNDHVNALRTHQKSLELKRIVGDNKGEAISFETMAEDAEYDDDINGAIENYEKALQIYEKLGLKEDITRIKSALEDLKASKTANSDDDMYMFKSRDFL